MESWLLQAPASSDEFINFRQGKGSAVFVPVQPASRCAFPEHQMLWIFRCTLGARFGMRNPGNGVFRCSEIEVDALELKLRNQFVVV